MKAMYKTLLLGTKFGDGQNLLFTLGRFFNKNDYSSAEWLDSLLNNLLSEHVYSLFLSLAIQVNWSRLGNKYS